MSTVLRLLISVLMLAAFCALCVPTASAEPYTGFTLFGRNNGSTTTLVDMSNSAVHTWTSSRNGGYSSYLLSNGHIMRSANAMNPPLNGGGVQGVVQEYNWSNTIVWEYTYSTSAHVSHHDIEPMPNGNVLLIAWEVKTAAQAIQAGLNHSASIWPDHIVEVQPTGSNTGTIVWEWHVWDHLVQDYDATKSNYGVVSAHPELLDINVSGGGGGGPGGGDWMHTNGISYNPTLDQIVISSHTLNEIYVIDHSTTTAQAASHAGGNAGHGGDFLYRWGNPANYNAPGTAYFDVVHSAMWVPPGYPGAGDIMAFNNREGQGTSIVCEIVPPYSGTYNYSWTPGTAYAPAAPVWTYTASGFYSNHLGWCERLLNGNTIISESTSGYFFEVNSAGTVQWSYSYGLESVTVHRYDPCYGGVSAIGVCPPVSATLQFSAGALTLSWTAVSGATQYKIYRLADPSDPISLGTLVTTVTGTSAALTADLATLTKAIYTVTAVR
jgi:hypothetical protein